MALTNKGIFQDKRTKEKIDLHLRDINDQITEKDIENVETDVTRLPEPASEVDDDAISEVDRILHDRAATDKSKEDENNTNSVETPWNMLD